MNEDRYYMHEWLGTYRIYDSYLPGHYIAVCYDDLKADLIVALLNDSWNLGKGEG